MTDTTDLHESEQRYRRLFEAAPIGIIMTEMKGRFYRHVNPAFCRMVGYEGHELIGKSVNLMTHAEDVEETEARINSLNSNIPVSYPIEKRFVKKNGETLWTSLTCTRVSEFPGDPAYYLVMVEDISERKQTLQFQLEHAAAQKFSLVREVHHRIKNNLQSVAGLLGRELGGHSELHPRLEVAISQVNAIAAVHGLKSAGSSETILLCETLQQICKAVGSQTRRALQWGSEGDCSGMPAVQIVEGEAVPVALILNELLFNAVKHSPPDADPPVVNIESDSESSRVEIVNSSFPGKDFDLASGRGLNTGLRLLLSLMPVAGATLNFRGSGTDRVVSELVLTRPVVVPSHEE